MRGWIARRMLPEDLFTPGAAYRPRLLGVGGFQIGERIAVDCRMLEPVGHVGEDCERRWS